MPVINKKCYECNTIKPLEDFYVNNRTKYGRATYCKACTKIKYQQRGPRIHKPEAVEASKDRMKNMRAYIRTHKEKPCLDCGIQYPYYVMQFDHRNPAEKSYGLSGSLSRSKESVDAEIAKCDVVCANCHAERTYQQRLTTGESGDKLDS